MKLLKTGIFLGLLATYYVSKKKGLFSSEGGNAPSRSKGAGKRSHLNPDRSGSSLGSDAATAGAGDIAREI